MGGSVDLLLTVNPTNRQGVSAVLEHPLWQSLQPGRDLMSTGPLVEHKPSRALSGSALTPAQQMRELRQTSLRRAHSAGSNNTIAAPQPSDGRRTSGGSRLLPAIMTVQGREVKNTEDSCIRGGGIKDATSLHDMPHKRQVRFSDHTIFEMDLPLVPRDCV